MSIMLLNCVRVLAGAVWVGAITYIIVSVMLDVVRIISAGMFA